jgi:RNA-directed DNA polymerase
MRRERCFSRLVFFDLLMPMKDQGALTGIVVLVVVLLICFLNYVYFAYVSYRRLTNNRPWQWLRTKLGWGHDKKELARRLGMNQDELECLEPSYRERFIAKRRGGQRRLLVPDQTLMAVQRRILRRLLRRLRAHPAAIGFEIGKSVVHNAAPHVGRRVVIKLDLVDFFPSTRADRVEAYFRRVGWNAPAAALLTRLCTFDGALPQGAPTSPRLSNLINFAFDARLDRFVRRRKGIHTRYADDLTISFPRDYPRRVRGTVQYVRRLALTFGCDAKSQV